MGTRAFERREREGLEPALCTTQDHAEACWAAGKALRHAGCGVCVGDVLEVDGRGGIGVRVTYELWRWLHRWWGYWFR